MPGEQIQDGARCEGGLVSVVVPCRDCERYVGDAIASVLAQTWRRREVIVVDDGSRDGTGEAVRRFGAAVRVHRQPAAGAGAARNAGVELARGVFIAFLDADDLWPEDSLANRMDGFARTPELDVVFGNATQFVSPELPLALSERLRCPAGAISVRVPGTMVVRREAFNRVGLFPTGVVVGEALDWWLRADEIGLRSAAVDEVVLRRRLHGGNLGVVESGRRGDYLRIVKAALDRRRAPAATAPERRR